MSTKRNPGAYDCYAAAHPDEPLFILRADDALAPGLVQLWTILRTKSFAMEAISVLIGALHALAARKPDADPHKIAEALQCAADMARWHMLEPEERPTEPLPPSTEVVSHQITIDSLCAENDALRNEITTLRDEVETLTAAAYNNGRRE